jgi:hypothetical protein
LWPYNPPFFMHPPEKDNPCTPSPGFSGIDKMSAGPHGRSGAEYPGPSIQGRDSVCQATYAVALEFRLQNG